MFKKSSLAVATAGACFMLLGVTSAIPAHAATPRKSWSMQCTDGPNTVYITATIVGSGAPTARYGVVLTTFDKKDDNFAPYIRLKSLNKDGSITNYPWRKGGQGKNVLTRWDTTLQQPKGLKILWVEGYAQGPRCTDYLPK
ncbi:hypothetical protein OG905_38560 [Streptomyces sp. NBC_00322]|uniref:hypothetical protein n=1 Tax=Streptomyces sp. NBC_00322 TaxID=2975712 RepID=UPI002E28AC0A|nr:hypothetical protein [Streptomyces sp. NBC_00322]